VRESDELATARSNLREAEAVYERWWRRFLLAVGKLTKAVKTIKRRQRAVAAVETREENARIIAREARRSAGGRGAEGGGQ
jgi:hypothetical protein